MNKRYFIFEGISGGASRETTESDYQKAKESRNIVHEAFMIEETFSLAARAYIELEKTLISASLEWSMEDAEYASNSEFFDHWMEVINLNVLSLLTAGSAYTERMESLAKRTIIDGFTWTAYEPVLRKTFDTSFSYRVMCALRNFSVHDRLPITRIQFAIKNETATGKLSKDEPWRQRVTCSPQIRTEPLIDSGKINQKRRDELKNLNVTAIDLKQFTRGYVENLFALHLFMRLSTETSLRNALDSLQAMEKSLSEIKGEKCKFTYVGENKTDPDNAIFIDTSRLSRILEKRRAWGKLKNLRRRYISSETTSYEGVNLGESANIWINS